MLKGKRMTKEELEKEAEEYADTKVKDRKGYNARWEFVRNAYLAGAEPREKQIAELTEQNTSLLTSVENLNKSVQELETQIEKMKCCEICVNSNGCGVCLSNNVCKNHSEWKLKE